jgi:hypothetical protein
VIPALKRHSIGFLAEHWAPLIVGIMSGALGWHYGYLHLLSVSWGTAFLDRVLTISAILVGYLIAVIAILPAVNQKLIIQKLQSWGYFQRLVDYFGSAIWSSFLLVGTSVLPAVLQYSVKANWTVDGVFSAIWWFIFGFTATAVVRATRLLLKLLAAH